MSLFGGGGIRSPSSLPQSVNQGRYTLITLYSNISIEKVEQASNELGAVSQLFNT